MAERDLHGGDKVSSDDVEGHVRAKHRPDQFDEEYRAKMFPKNPLDGHNDDAQPLEKRQSLSE